MDFVVVAVLIEPTGSIYKQNKVRYKISKWSLKIGQKKQRWSTQQLLLCCAHRAGVTAIIKTLEIGFRYCLTSMRNNESSLDKVCLTNKHKFYFPFLSQWSRLASITLDAFQNETRSGAAWLNRG